MRERPILFSTPMVQAILAGRKMQTRREINHFGNTYHSDTLLCDWGLSDDPCHIEGQKWEWELQTDVDDGRTFPLKCPYGSTSDILWVRETFQKIESGRFIYKADPIIWGGKWKPSIFMPKEACRIRLEITDIRVERLNDISGEECLKEGIETLTKDNTVFKFGLDGWVWAEMPRSRKDAYRRLWESINGPDSWSKNPWVWVIEFKRIEP